MQVAHFILEPLTRNARYVINKTVISWTLRHLSDWLVEIRTQGKQWPASFTGSISSSSIEAKHLPQLNTND